MRNWSGNLAYRAARLHAPGSIDELQELVRGTPRIRALGSRHSFNELADTTGDLVSLDRLPRVLEIDPRASTVTVDGAVRYGDVTGRLDAAGLAFHNLGSLPHISIAGACATATHGSGDRSGVLSTAVVGLELVRGDGELVQLGEDDAPTLRAAVVGLGALGVVTRLTLRVEPAFAVRQDVYERLPAAVFADRFDELTALGRSVSGFTRWREPVFDQVWVKQQLADGDAGEAPDELWGAPRATRDLHPVPGMPGRWHERIPHFRLEFTPSAGDELQAEYFVARSDAVAALEALEPLRREIADVVFVTEVRTIAADDLALSPANGRPTVSIHFTWRPVGPAVAALLPRIEAALEPFAPRPHWAKLFTLDPAVVRSRSAGRPGVVALARRLDPDGVFRNGFVDRFVFGED